LSLEMFIGIMYGRRFASATELESSSKDRSMMEGVVEGGRDSKRAEALEEEEKEEEEEEGGG